MDFTIKTYRIPITREDGVIKLQEIKLDEEVETASDDISLEFSFQIPPMANDIAKWNKMQITIAETDKDIQFVQKKVLCKRVN